MCSARHSKHTRPGIGTLWSVPEVNRTICDGQPKKISAFSRLDLDLLPQPWPKCIGAILVQSRNILVFSWNKSDYLQQNHGKKTISAFLRFSSPWPCFLTFQGQKCNGALEGLLWKIFAVNRTILADGHRTTDRPRPPRVAIETVLKQQCCHWGRVQ